MFQEASNIIKVKEQSQKEKARTGAGSGEVKTIFKVPATIHSISRQAHFVNYKYHELGPHASNLYEDYASNLCSI